MPKLSTFPTLYDECKTLSISFLKKYGYLQPDQWRTGSVTWSRNGNKTASISIATFTCSDTLYLELDYKCNNKQIRYKVALVSLPSNLGKGVVWFFLCPNTGKRCRKLYLADTYFLHRAAFRGCMYEKQTYSSSKRKLYQSWDKLFCTDKIYEQIYGKHFKKQYAGKPTKKYLRLWRKLKDAETVSEIDLLNHLR